MGVRVSLPVLCRGYAHFQVYRRSCRSVWLLCNLHCLQYHHCPIISLVSAGLACWSNHQWFWHKTLHQSTLRRLSTVALDSQSMKFHDKPYDNQDWPSAEQLSSWLLPPPTFVVLSFHTVTIREIGLTRVVVKTLCRKHKPQIRRKMQGPVACSGSCGIWEISGRDQLRESPHDRNFRSTRLDSPRLYAYSSIHRKVQSRGLCLAWLLLKNDLEWMWIVNFLSSTWATCHIWDDLLSGRRKSAKK